MQDFRVLTNQIELQVREFKNDGEVIIFLHYGGSNLMMWEKAIPFFQDNYHLVLIDLRGHGRSDEPDSGYDIDTMASDVVGVMVQLKIERAHVIGSSMGAEVALGLAAKYPERVSSLICDGALYNEHGPYSTRKDSEEDFKKFVDDQIANIVNAPITNFPSEGELLEVRKKAYTDLGWNELIEKVERYGIIKLAEGQYTRAFGKKSRECYFKHYFYNHLEDHFARLKCPMLMIPDEEEMENEQAKAAMVNLIGMADHATIEVVKGWVHPYGWLLNPGIMCTAILRFMNSQVKKIH